MGGDRMTRLEKAVTGLAAAVCAVVAGVYLVAGPGVALIVGGVLVGGLCLLLVDVDHDGRTSP